MAHFLAIILSAALLILTANAQSRQILDPTISNYKNLAQFAILQHNSCANTTLKYGALLAAELQGGNYWFIIQESGGTEYEATISTASGSKFPVLQSFNEWKFEWYSTSGKPMYANPTSAYYEDSYGRFAIDQYNNQTNGSLKFIKLFQVTLREHTTGLIIQAKNNGAKNLYSARVVQYPWEGRKKRLESFGKI